VTTADYKEMLPSLPDVPGVYQYADDTGTVIYVGKAKNLKKRIGSYFGEKKHMAHKTKIMVKNAATLNYTVVETEQDALLLESTLIKRLQPRYNVMLKDGKSYVYIIVKNERFPRVFFTRKVIKDGSTYYGPYTSKYRANVLHELIKKLFKIRTCKLNLSQANIEKNKFKLCLEYHIGNCKGPCVGKESVEDYDAKIQQVKNILRGNFKPVKDYIYEQIAFHAERLEYEEAEEFKQKLVVFEDYQSKSTVASTSIEDVDVFNIQMDETKAYVNYLKVVNGALINTADIVLEQNLNTDPDSLLLYGIQIFREKYNSIAPELIVPVKLKYPDEKLKITVPQIGDKKKLLELAAKNLRYTIIQAKKQDLNKIRKQRPTERILKTIQSDLNMDEVPFHMECFDNSNIQGTNPTASCVVFKNAKPSKKDYRHFKIKTVVGPDDFASMEEVVYRRYKRLVEEEKSLPQLVVIDGGKGQLSSAMKSITKLGLEKKIVVVGIAKRLEEIYFPGDSVPLYINKKSESLKVLQQIRNEAHRFALALHRNLRSNNFLGTELTQIPGIGEKTADKLLTHFGSVKKLREAPLKEIEELFGLSVRQKIQKYFTASEEE
jgi:excinuclease ABC subunit C